MAKRSPLGGRLRRKGRARRSRINREIDEQLRKMKDDYEAHASSVLDSGAGVVLVTVIENLEERLAIPVSRVHCEREVLKTLLADLANVVGHGPGCHHASFMNAREWGAFAPSGNWPDRGVLEKGQIWISPDADSPVLRAQIEEILEGKTRALDLAALDEAGVARIGP